VIRCCTPVVDDTPPLVLLESPYAGNVALNVRYARLAMRDSILRGEYPLASHLLYTQIGILNDGDLSERELGIEAGLAWGRHASASIVYTDLGITPGMRLGLERAKDLGRVVELRRLRGWP
jgi:hypothetical protein